MLNWNLLKHPMNWIIVTIMVLLGAIVFHFLASYTFPNNPLSTALGKKQ